MRDVFNKDKMMTIENTYTFRYNFYYSSFV